MPLGAALSRWADGGTLPFRGAVAKVTKHITRFPQYLCLVVAVLRLAGKIPCCLFVRVGWVAARGSNTPPLAQL